MMMGASLTHAVTQIFNKIKKYIKTFNSAWKKDAQNLVAMTFICFFSCFCFCFWLLLLLYQQQIYSIIKVNWPEKEWWWSSSSSLFLLNKHIRSKYRSCYIHIFAIWVFAVWVSLTLSLFSYNHQIRMMMIIIISIKNPNQKKKLITQQPSSKPFKIQLVKTRWQHPFRLLFLLFFIDMILINHEVVHND